MSDRPSWWDQVKEVDREEAEVLFRLGLPVWCDWPVDPRDPVWDGVYCIQVKVDYRLTKEWQTTKQSIYYVKKGEALE